MIMKYILRHMAAMAPVLLIATVVSCSRELDDTAAEALDGKAEAAEAGGLRAIIVNPGETRTDFDGYVGKFAWSEGDKIAIHLSDGSFYESTVDAETGAFTCSTTPSKQRDAYAVYPASARDASNYGSPTLKVVLPAEYDITGNLASDYAPVPMIAVNRQGEDDLYFRHVGSLLRITCDRVPSSTRYIRVTFDRNVAGSFPVLNLASDHPTLGEGGDSPSVTFRVASNYLQGRKSGIVLNVPVPTGEVSSVTVTAVDNARRDIQSSTRDLSLSLSRGYGKKLAFNVIPAFHDSMQMVITASEENSMTFRLPFMFMTSSTSASFPAELIVDWGDGSTTFFDEGGTYEFASGLFDHTYAAAGDYTITLSGVATTQEGPYLPYFNFEMLPAQQRNMLKSVPTPILPFRSGSRYFYQCNKLESICEGLFSKNPQIGFSEAFYRCSSLREIPEDLFSYNPNATNFQSTFEYCSGLTCPIPEKLFANNPNAQSFWRTFAGASFTGSIPERLFANCPLVTSFYMTFSGCSSLTGPIPGKLFSNCPNATTFFGTFWDARNLSGPLPDYLFANNTLATNFNYTFYICCNLTGTIPGHLFPASERITAFSNTFANCERITGVDAGLFANCPNVTSFNSVFYVCKSLQNIPGDLFRYNTKVTDFRSAFASTGITSIPAGLFSHNPEVTDFSSVFHWCRSLNTPLPENLFAGCTKVTTFASAFWADWVLPGPLPGRLFADCTEVTTFASCFGGCTNLRGPLPAGLFANNAKVTTFNGLFLNCDSLSGTIPAGFFANNPLAVDFTYAFCNCRYLKASGGIFTNETATPATRFMSVESPVNFTCCFSGLGSYLNNTGTAPELWDFSFPEAYPPVTAGCFGYGSNLSNWENIPTEWR